jgi:hypothetical protein
MRIVEETDNKLVVKKTESHLGKILLVVGVLGAFFALALIAGTNGQTPGKSRTSSGAAVFVFPLAGIIFLFLDRRQNRKALILDSSDRTVTIIGSKTDKVSFDRINNVYLGKNAVNNAAQIEFEMKDGQRFGTGIDAHRGRPDEAETILQKVKAKFTAPPEILQ